MAGLGGETNLGGHLFAPLTLVFCKGAAIYKRDTNCHPAYSATHKRDVFSWVWHEASPYFDTPVALYGYDYANRDYASRDYTNRRFGMEFASRFRADGGVAERR